MEKGTGAPQKASRSLTRHPLFRPGFILMYCGARLKNDKEKTRENFIKDSC
jgi:hypothetical protein